MKEGCWEIPPSLFILLSSRGSHRTGHQRKGNKAGQGIPPERFEKKGLGFLFLEFFDSFSDAGRFLI
jgi:hypothetical protein